ncbi:hemerythrin domain-containing protein [Altericroceibacterium endophyticum]|uniref:Hemerythrin domain-containing protein n=1 Tax=Altericroceibacterium endophyticum TaxID=1808508 RepID=A0A6I4T446_9SPHN|nr:hemerythrin domain-containing protein [Altericroceibacterium endophyticum]MXO64740.1 hemerythrin domain-containing protein [Altericroceibacterium endophyticum]
MAREHDIFKRLKQDHDRQRDLLEKIEQTHGESEDRARLFESFTVDAKSHAAAEEQALYSTMMRKPETTGETRHSVAEHHEIEEALNDIAATDMSSSAWLTKFKQLKHDYLHHIDEEEDEHFPDFSKYLNDADIDHMEMVFDRRKDAECEDAEVTPEKKDEAKE